MDINESSLLDLHRKGLLPSITVTSAMIMGAEMLFMNGRRNEISAKILKDLGAENGLHCAYDIAILLEMSLTKETQKLVETAIDNLIVGHRIPEIYNLNKEVLVPERYLALLIEEIKKVTPIR